MQDSDHSPTGSYFLASKYSVTLRRGLAPKPFTSCSECWDPISPCLYHLYRRQFFTPWVLLLKRIPAFVQWIFSWGFLVQCFTRSAGRLQAQLFHFTVHFHTFRGIRPRVLKMGYLILDWTQLRYGAEWLARTEERDHLNYLADDF